MNELRFKDLLCLFCCPPVPSKIGAKIAFLPPPPSYKFIPDTSSKYKIALTDYAKCMYSQGSLKKMEGYIARTSKRNKIACLFVKCSSNPRFTIIYSHGNAVDLGIMSNFYYGLGVCLDCNVFSYDYSGYGISTGKPSERNLYADIECAWKTLKKRYHVGLQNVIVYGQSIGTVPSVKFATKHNVAALVLHSPIASGLRVAFPGIKRDWCCDIFSNITMIKKVKSPVLVIHGKKDELIDYSHGKALYNRCRKKMEPLWVEGAGHNDIESHEEYLQRLKKLVLIDLADN